MSQLWLSGRKQCSKCHVYKLPAAYHERGDRPGVLRSQCRECINAPHRKRKTPEARFWGAYRDKTTRVGECLEWTGGYNNGYPRGTWRGKSVLVRRQVYKLAIGALADDEYVIDTCDNKRCVRHTHLVRATYDEMNLKRMNHAATGDRHSSRTHPERLSRGDTHPMHLHPELANPRRGSRHGLAKLTEDDIPIIRAMSADGVTQTKIAARFGVCSSAIWHVLHGKTWAHV